MRRYFNSEKQRRLAPLVLVGGLLASGKVAYDAVPRSRQVRLVPADEQRASLRSVRVLYLVDDEMVAGLEHRFPDGMPREVVHFPDLSPGEYDIRMELTDAAGKTQRLHKTLTVGDETGFRIALDARP